MHTRHLLKVRRFNCRQAPSSIRYQKCGATSLRLTPSRRKICAVHPFGRLVFVNTVKSMKNRISCVNRRAVAAHQFRLIYDFFSRSSFHNTPRHAATVHLPSSLLVTRVLLLQIACISSSDSPREANFFRRQTELLQNTRGRNNGTSDGRPRSS